MPLSDLSIFGTPYTFMYSRMKLITLSRFVCLQIVATAQQLFLSTATSMNVEQFICLLIRFPMKSV